MNFALAKIITPTITGDFRLSCTASSETIDGDGDIIRKDGWQLGRVAAGQVKLLDSHKSRGITNILGSVDSAIVTPEGLECGLRYAVEESPLAAFAWRMTVGKFLTGYSVGFAPKAIATLEDIRDESGNVVMRANQRLWDAACASMGIDPKATAETCSRIIVAAELCELSAIGAPSNPDAMVKALAAGALLASASLMIEMAAVTLRRMSRFPLGPCAPTCCSTCEKTSLSRG